MPQLAVLILQLQIVLECGSNLWRDPLHSTRDVTLHQKIPVFATFIRIEHAIAESIVELNSSINCREQGIVVVTYLKDHLRQHRDVLCHVERTKQHKYTIITRH